MCLMPPKLMGGNGLAISTEDNENGVVTLVKNQFGQDPPLSCLMVILVSRPKFGKLTLNVSTLKESSDMHFKMSSLLLHLCRYSVE